jgi:hypothetical protein
MSEFRRQFVSMTPEAFGAMDRHLLENIAQQAGMVVHVASSRRLAVCPTESSKVQTVAGKNAAPKKCYGAKENKTFGYLSGGLDP